MIGPAGTFAAPKEQPKHDIEVQCTRCRNRHMESDRIEKPTNKYGVRAMTLVCPKCGGHTYYKVTPNAEVRGD